MSRWVTLYRAMTRSEMLDLVEQWSPVREMFDYRNLVFSHRELRGICCVLIADPTVEQLSYRSYIAIFYCISANNVNTK